MTTLEGTDRPRPRCAECGELLPSGMPAPSHVCPPPIRATHVGLGVLTACLGAFPAAGLVALVYGFPVPFGGKLQGPDAVVPAMRAVLFYGVLGGFVVLGVAGAAAAGIASKVSKGNAAGIRRLTFMYAFGASLAGAIGLAVLDLFIGQW